MREVERAAHKASGGAAIYGKRLFVREKAQSGSFDASQGSQRSACSTNIARPILEKSNTGVSGLRSRSGAKETGPAKD